jgi:hypothetical protein
MPGALSGTLACVHAALDALSAPLAMFVRDDDAGWADERLFALLGVTERAGVPIDLAAIPQAIGECLAAELRARMEGGYVGVHQHGFAHLNHEADGRKCEFGPARDGPAQRADLTQGRDRLRKQFGDRLDAIFTPPWNRCAGHTPGLLARLGFAALSRDRSAPAQADLPELAVDVDWSRGWREGAAPAVARALATAIAARGRDRRPLGLMLHHAAMDDGELAALHQTLVALSHHPHVRALPMRALLARNTSLAAVAQAA